MTDGLNDNDTKAIADAVAILRAAGYDVVKISEGRKPEAGHVAFDLHVRAGTSYDRFLGQVEAMKEVAEETPTVNMAGDLVEDEEDGDGC